MQSDLVDILAMCEKLNEVDTEGVEPLIYLTNSETVLRDDVVVQTITHEEALKNAKSDIDLAKAQSELAVMAAQLSALRKYRQKR
jgi:aspartyl/glutamyl-tRNA(Asn/Gln) amidotransferase C subunit